MKLLAGDHQGWGLNSMRSLATSSAGASLRGFRRKPPDTALVSLTVDDRTSLSLLYRMKAKPNVKRWLTTMEMHSAVSAALQARMTGEVVKGGCRDKACRAESRGAMSINCDPPVSIPSSSSGPRVKLWSLKKEGISSSDSYSLLGR